MSGTGKPSLQSDRQTAASIARELASLEQMTSGELAEKYRELVGEPPRTRNKQYLRKRIAWRIQERIEGGLSSRALERINQLAPQAPVRWRAPVVRKDSKQPPVVAIAPARDPRLPPAGTVLMRVHEGVEHKVIVLSDGGFEYQGERHRSLSKIARLITGTAWNGYLFFFGRAGGGAR